MTEKTNEELEAMIRQMIAEYNQAIMNLHMRLSRVEHGVGMAITPDNMDAGEPPNKGTLH